MTPDHEGYFWAKLVTPVNMPEGEDWVSSSWEVVEVFDNNGEGAEEFMVFLLGVQHPQPLRSFDWGPEVDRPHNLTVG